jgi:hypothetical protein
MPDCQNEPDLCSDFLFLGYEFFIDLKFQFNIKLNFNRAPMDTYINLIKDLNLKISFYNGEIYDKFD